MDGSRVKHWFVFFFSSFATSMFIMTLISIKLYHNGLFGALQQSFLPSIGAALIFSTVAFFRPSM